MKDVDLYLKVRHAVRIEGLSERAAAHRCAARPAHPSRPYPANERRKLQAQSEQEPLTPCQLGHTGG